MSEAPSPSPTAGRSLAGLASLWQFRLAAVLVAAALGAFLAIRQRPAAPPAESFAVPETGPSTVAATGDTVISQPVAPSERGASFDAIVDVVRSATLAITNLEMNLLGEPNAASARGGPGPRWPFGSAREAEELASLGFDVVGQANNHAADYGQDGMAETSAMLTGVWCRSGWHRPRPRRGPSPHGLSGAARERWRSSPWPFPRQPSRLRRRRAGASAGGPG